MTKFVTNGMTFRLWRKLCLTININLKKQTIMEKIKLEQEVVKAKNNIINVLTDFVRKNGEDMCEYFRSEMGIDDSEVIKVLDVSDPGCFFTTQDGPNVEIENHNSIESYVIGNFTHWSFWAFYIVQDELKYYAFVNPGIEFDLEESTAIHGKVSDLSLAELQLIVDVLAK